MNNKKFKQQINAGHQHTFRNIGNATGRYSREAVHADWDSTPPVRPVKAAAVFLACFAACWLLLFLAMGG